MTTLLIVLCAYLDRLRGSSWRLLPEFDVGSYTIKGGDTRLLYGWVVAALYGHAFSWLTIPIMVLFALGESFGWGEPIGSALQGKPQDPERLEKWQKGPLKDSPWLSLVVRGLMWGAPVALLSWWEPLLLSLPVIFMLTMPLAVLIARHTPGDTSRKWKTQEILRGLLTGISIATVSWWWPNIEVLTR